MPVRMSFIFFGKAVLTIKRKLSFQELFWKLQRSLRCSMIKGDHWPVKHFKEMSVKKDSKCWECCLNYIQNSNEKPKKAC